MLPLYIFLSQLNSRIIVAMQTWADFWCVHNIALYWWLFMDQFLPKFAHCQQSYDPLNFETNHLLSIKHIRFPLRLILYLLGIFSVTSWYCRSRLTKTGVQINQFQCFLLFFMMGFMQYLININIRVYNHHTNRELVPITPYSWNSWMASYWYYIGILKFKKSWCINLPWVNSLKISLK